MRLRLLLFVRDHYNYSIENIGDNLKKIIVARLKLKSNCN